MIRITVGFVTAGPGRSWTPSLFADHAEQAEVSPAVARGRSAAAPVASGGMRLCPYGEGDLALTLALETDPVVMRHLGGAAGEERAVAVHRRRLAGAAAGDWYRTIVPDDGSGPVGLTGIWRTPWEGGTIHEFGVMFRPEYQRRGLGVAAGRLLFAEVGTAVRELHAFTAVGNDGAARGCRRLGFAQVADCDLDYEGEPLRCHHWVRVQR